MERYSYNHIIDTVKGIKDTPAGRVETYYPISNEGKPLIYQQKSPEIYYTKRGEIVSPTDSHVGKIIDVKAE